MSAITLRGVRKAFGSDTVLDGVDLTVPEGGVFTLLGTNGAGKSTTIGILTTLLRPDAGTVTVAGIDALANPIGVTRRISLTGQSAAVDDGLTGRENLRLLGRLSGLSSRTARARASALLDRFSLADAADRRTATYSGGMRRRLDLALSFLVRPQILFLDEPTTGLDTRSRREVWDLVQTLATSGTTIFLTTQYLEEADRLGGRIAVLDAGRIVAEGTAQDLKRRVGGETVEVHDRHGALLASRPTDGTVAGVRAALADLGVDTAQGTVTVRHPTLDDVFLNLTAKESA